MIAYYKPTMNSLIDLRFAKGYICQQSKSASKILATIWVQTIQRGTECGHIPATEKGFKIAA